jgi:hypothetical protein
VFVRALARWLRVRTLQIEDFMLLFAFASYVTMLSLYLVVNPYLYRILAVAAGFSPFYPGMFTEGDKMLRLLFAVTTLFWTVLWSVKFSLLFFFRRLSRGLPSYTKAWWLISVITFLAYVGCIVSQVTSCSSLKAWFTMGMSPSLPLLNDYARLTHFRRMRNIQRPSSKEC